MRAPKETSAIAMFDAIHPQTKRALETGMPVSSVASFATASGPVLASILLQAHPTSAAFGGVVRVEALVDEFEYLLTRGAHFELLGGRKLLGRGSVTHRASMGVRGTDYVDHRPRQRWTGGIIPTVAESHA